MEELRKLYVTFLQKILKFDVWHISSDKERPYVNYLIKEINSLNLDGKVVEIGCGLGDIISNIKLENKMGCDIDKKVIIAAHLLHPKVKFCVGSFKGISSQKISVLIAVNFLHTFNRAELERELGGALGRNDINMIIVDEVPSPPYAYSHDYQTFFQKEGYSLYKKSRGFAAMHGRRYLLFFKKNRNAG